MGAAMASYEEAFRVTAHESHVESRAQAERKAPLLLPDDHWGCSPARPERRQRRVVDSSGRGCRAVRWLYTSVMTSR